MTVLAWKHATTEIPGNGLSVQRSATPEECATGCAALGILGCEAIDVRYRIRAVAGDGFRLEGSYKAKVTQACIVSLEPIAEVVEGELNVEFTPDPVARSGKDSKDGTDADKGEPFAEADIEPIENGMIDVGRVIFEELTAGLDPYPRAAGSQFDWQDPVAAKDKGAADNPFAKLAVLKPKKN